MTAKQYPVKIYYFYDGIHQPYHKPVYFHDKHAADSEAWRLAQSLKADVTIWVIEFPRTLNGEVALDLMMGRFDKYPRKRYSTARYYKPAEQPKKAEPPPKAKPHIPTDPYELLRVKRWTVTRGELQDAWKKAVQEHHPDITGGDHAWAAAVNAARDKIRREMGWK